MNKSIDAPIDSIKGVGEKTKEYLNKLGVYTIGDILLHFPRDYVKYPAPVALSELKDDGVCAVIVKVKRGVALKKTARVSLSILKANDGDVTLEAVWFNMPFIGKQLKNGSIFVFYGNVTKGNGAFKMEQPAVFTLADYDNLSERLMPLYALTKGLNNKALTKIVNSALNEVAELEDYLTADILKRNSLCSYIHSIEGVHFPENLEELIIARKRLVFDEFLLFILSVEIQKNHEGIKHSSWDFTREDNTKEYISKLPYALTGAQLKTIEEITSDLKKESLMQRLVQGDVGSGKTIVAFLCMLLASDNGYQSAIMAPTEVLATQHAENLKKLCDLLHLDKHIILMTGSMTAKEKRHAYDMAEGIPDALIVGTHALIQEKVKYNDLSLVITDEQHRFGVKERSALGEKGETPHILVMSATPIPRTLAMILYSDMSISVINEKPADRLPVKNCVVGESYRPTAYSFIKKQVEEGRQAIIVCPLVEESEGYEGINAIDHAKSLKAIFPESFNIEVLHGRLKSSEKEEIMRRFKDNEINILVSTTVIEVGIDVPNATVIMIENADRFGLAQIHQLRGRVGRGDKQSYCIMMNSSKSDRAKERLEVLNRSNDGFFIASEDLKMRGPGDFFGIRQSGELSFNLADIYQDADILSAASKEAKDIMEKDPDLSKEEHKKLKAKLYIDSDTLLSL